MYFIIKILNIKTLIHQQEVFYFTVVLFTKDTQNNDYRITITEKWGKIFQNIFQNIGYASTSGNELVRDLILYIYFY